MRIVAADIGGTNARFAIAELRPGERPRIGEARRYPTAEHPGLASAWRTFAADAGEPLPPALAVGAAGPVAGGRVRFVNSDWTIDMDSLAAQLGVERWTLLNDFGAVAQAVTVLEPDELAYLSGPESPLPADGITTVLGPGTGLGVAILLRRGQVIEVIETEGAHIGFAPHDQEEERIERALREQYGRCSVERVVSGPGLLDIYRALGGRSFNDDVALWEAALRGSDSAAADALDALVKAFGSAAGDLALAHGSNAVVISSGLSRQLGDKLRLPLFRGRFIAKGRYRAHMESIPVRLALHEEPGLLGAAVAFQRRHGP